MAKTDRIPWAMALELFTKKARDAGNFDATLKAGDVELIFSSMDTDLDLEEVVKLLKDRAGFMQISEARLVLTE